MWRFGLTSVFPIPICFILSGFLPNACFSCSVPQMQTAGIKVLLFNQPLPDLPIASSAGVPMTGEGLKPVLAEIVMTAYKEMGVLTH